MNKNTETKKKNVKKYDLKVLDISNCKIVDLEIKDIIPNVINNVLVTILDGEHHIILPSDMIGEKYKNWFKGKGGVFSKDVHNHSFGKNSSRYILLEKENKKCILRLIDDEEYPRFESLRLIDGMIKDVPYMILLDGIDELTSTKVNYKEDIIVEENLNNQSFFPNKNPMSADDIEYHNESISLFED
jgi:hypothetical protein